MKKILSLLLALSLCLSIVPVTASAATAPEMLLDINYDDEISNTKPVSLTMESDGSVAYVHDDGNGKSLMVKNQWSKTYVKYLASPTGIFWVDVAMQGEDRNVDRNLIELWGHATFIPTPLMKVSKSGQLLDAAGKSYGFIDPTEKHRFTAKINFNTFRYDAYLDGKLIAERLQLPDKSSLTEVTTVGFSTGENALAEGKTKFDFIKVYYADELPDLSAFPAPKYEPRERTLRKANVQEPKGEASELLHSEDFESAKIGGTPNGFHDHQKTASVQEDHDGNKVLLFEATKPGTDGIYVNVFMGEIGLDILPAYFVYQYDIKCQKMSNTVDLMMIRDMPGSNGQTLKLLPSGDIVTRSGSSIGANCYNKWVNIAIATDLVRQVHDIYVDGELVLNDLAVQTVITKEQYHFRTVLMESSFVTGECKFMYDNVRWYSGTKVFGKDEEIKQAETGYVFQPEKEDEKWEREIDASALKVDMSKFNLVQTMPREKEADRLYAHYAKGLPGFDGMIVFKEGTSNMWIRDAKYTTSNPKIHWDDEKFLAPADTLAALTSEQAVISGNTVTIGNMTATVGEKKITVNGETYETNVAVRKLEGTIYIPIREYATYKLNKYYSECEHGIALISDKVFDLTLEAKEREFIAPMVAWLSLDRPNQAKLKADFAKTTGIGTHPRLFGRPERVTQLFEAAKTDPTLKKLLDGLLEYAENCLNNRFSTGGHTVKNSSFEVVEAFYVAYLYTGDERYPKKAEELAFLLTDMGTWKHDSYFLDVSTWLMVTSEVYDLFYHQLSQESRDRIATRLIKLGLQSADKHYYGSFSDWPTRLGNWNTVCNGGPIAAAIALYGDGYNDALCIDVLEKVTDSLGYCIWEYAPHGGLTESGHYWEFGTEYLTRSIEMFEFNFGTSYGLTNFSGMLEMPYWPFYAGTSSGDWAYHDDPPAYDWSRVNTSYACWGAYRMKDYNLQRLRYDRLEKEKATVYFYDFFYYMKDPNPQPGVVDLDKTFEYQEMAFSRNDATLGKEQFWLGIHALKNTGPHLQYDLGNFVYEAYGIRWAMDYGRGSYGLPEYNTSESEGSGKGKVYPCRAEGHNLYVIEPTRYQGQHFWATDTYVEEIGFSPVCAAYKVDLTGAYYSWASKALRGYMLTNQRTCLVIQDEITIREKYEGETIKWFWQTMATPIVNPDKSVTLLRDGFMVTLHFDSNVEFDVEAHEVKPLPQSPDVKGGLDLIDPDARTIEVTFYADEPTTTFRCIAMPIGYEMERGEIVPIDEWTIEQGTLNTAKTQADMIYIDGKPLEDFDPNNTKYTVYGSFSITGMPNITADADGKVTVLKQEGINDAIGVMVEGANGAKRVYGIKLIDLTTLGAPKTGASLPIAEVTAMDSDGNTPEGAVDMNLATRWSGATQGDNWWQVDFGSEQEFDALVLSVYEGSKRRNNFDILISNDGLNWTTLRSDVSSSGTTREYEIMYLPLTKARYVKLMCHAADTSTYNSYQEILFWKL